MKIGLAQINPTVGDVAGNGALIADAIAQAREAGADLVVTPELCVSGYPPKDLLLRPDFVDACAREAKRLGESITTGVTAIIGTPLPLARGGVANSLVVYRDNTLVDYYDKRLLPTYDVFDEDRYFVAGSRSVVIDLAGQRIGLAICEDLWHGEDAGFVSRYTNKPDPVEATVKAGANIIVAASASPYVLGKHDRHVKILRDHARKHGVFICSVNQVGANDDLIFDGRACVVDPTGKQVVQAQSFRQDLMVYDTTAIAPDKVQVCELGPEGNAIEALTLGVRDYFCKTGFRKAIIGLSGGIDSAITAAIAVRALGSDAVLGVAMPGPFSSEHALADAADLAERLRITMLTIPIGSMCDTARETIDTGFDVLDERRLGASLPDLADQNLQARARGVVLMTLSNRTGALVLTTGNKSEIAVGYCTLYGDMNGALAVLSDVPKTMVFRLARYMNERATMLGFERSPIPENTITKPPSAELAPGQVDQDSLPPYEVLDEIIERFVEHRQSVQAIIEQSGIDASVVQRITRLIDLNEYKRKQLAIGLKVTTVAFGFGRRLPIARGWWHTDSIR